MNFFASTATPAQLQHTRKLFTSSNPWGTSRCIAITQTSCLSRQPWKSHEMVLFAWLTLVRTQWS